MFSNDIFKRLVWWWHMPVIPAPRRKAEAGGSIVQAQLGLQSLSKNPLRETEREKDVYINIYAIYVYT